MVKVLGYLLVVIHVMLGIWAVGGILEMIVSKVPWKPFTNPEFPGWVLVIHWNSVLFAATVFLFGYFGRWKLTPYLMVAAYGAMALVCLIETFGFMTSKYKYVAMVGELVTYTIIVVLLFNEKFSSIHFDE